MFSKLPEAGSQEWHRQVRQATKAQYKLHKQAEHRQRLHYREIMGNAIDPTLGRARTGDSTLPEFVDLKPKSKTDRFSEAARTHMIDLIRQGDVHGNSN